MALYWRLFAAVVEIAGLPIKVAVSAAAQRSTAFRYRMIELAQVRRECESE